MVPYVCYAHAHTRRMDSIISYEALVVPSDDRAPHLASLMTSPLAFTDVHARQAEVYRAGRMPHPEILMDYIAEGLGPRGWRFQVTSVLYFLVLCIVL